MATQESNIATNIMIAACKSGATVWKNTRGFFLTLDGNRKIRAGLLAAGASDLIGFKRIIVTPDMIGKPIAIFCAIECKTSIGGNGSYEQKQFIKFIQDAGGIAGIARSPEEAINLLS